MSVNKTDALKKLLEEWPELREKVVTFSESGEILIQESGQAQVPVSNCKRTGYLPEIIRGSSPKVEVRKSAVHGYGVFAKEEILEGELIEECKLLKFRWRNQYHHDPVLSDYPWVNKDCDCEECKEHGHVKYLALGLGSIFNHADNPNTRQQLDYSIELMTVHAKQRILENEEIFINYGKKYWMIRDFWNAINKTNQLEKFYNDQIKPQINRK